MTVDAAKTTQGTKPPTLGDRIGDAMRSRNETADSLAQRLGVTAAEVGRWADDREVPTGAQVGVVAGYLGISDDEVRRLVLRSQMRNVQRDIRRDDTAGGGRP
jgi:transcriptional regulator with XRE-family HTH domain